MKKMGIAVIAVGMLVAGCAPAAETTADSWQKFGQDGTEQIQECTGEALLDCTSDVITSLTPRAQSLPQDEDHSDITYAFKAYQRVYLDRWGKGKCDGSVDFATRLNCDSDLDMLHDNHQQIVGGLQKLADGDSVH